jgi:hydrogenase maturation factor HypE
VHQRLGFFEGGALAHGHQALARSHDLRHPGAEPLFEAQVAVGDDADDAAAFDHRQAGDAVLRCSAIASSTRMSGGMVIGSRSTPASKGLRTGVRESARIPSIPTPLPL